MVLTFITHQHICLLFRYLVIVTRSHILVFSYVRTERYYLSYDGGVPQSVYVFNDGTIYWVVFHEANRCYYILCTSVKKVTRRLDLSTVYKVEIFVVVDRLYLYVLDESNNRIDVYSIRTLEKLWQLQIVPNAKELILAMGR